jgi:hypothetical protein
MALAGSKGPILAMLTSLAFYYLFNPYHRKRITDSFKFIIFIGPGFLGIKYSGFNMVFLENRINNYTTHNRYIMHWKLYSIVINQ